MMIKEKLMHLPTEIKTKRIELLNITNDVEVWKVEIKAIEAEEMEVINTATDSNGKPVFSNAEKRAAELEKKKKNNVQFCAANAQLVSLEKKGNDLKIELQYLIDVQANLRAIAMLGGTEA